jgi:hypothetical protein
MKKMKLNLDTLAVDSFDTAVPLPKPGTVFGEQCTCYTNCTCPGCPTCAHTCAYTCDDATCPNCPTCGQSCGDSCYGTCAGQYTCDNTCDSCYYTQCANTCYQCPTVSGSPCECWL